MSYAPTTDFVSLLRLVSSGGVRVERMPGLDFVVIALARAGFFDLSVSDTAPTTSQTTTAWFRPAKPSWAAEGVLYLWDADSLSYQPATTMLWSELLITSKATTNTQMIKTPGPVTIGATIDHVLVNQTVSAPITLILPLASTKPNEVLVCDWKGDAGLGNTISIQTTGTDIFPGAITTWQIAANTGSVLFHPITGLGYAI